MGPLDFFEMGHPSKGEIGNNPKKLQKSPQLQEGKTMDAMDTNSSLLPIFLLPMMPPPIAKRYQRVYLWVGLKSSVDDNNRFTIHLGSIYKCECPDKCLKNCCPPIFGRDLWAVQISYAIAGFPNPTSLVSCFPPE